MTREEAIHILNSLKPTNTKSSFDAYVVGKAITMAIKALEQNESAEEWYKLFAEKLEQEPKILDKIRAEIQAMSTDYCGGYIGLNKSEVLQIIDKYKAESEE